MSDAIVIGAPPPPVAEPTTPRRRTAFRVAAVVFTVGAIAGAVAIRPAHTPTPDAPAAESKSGGESVTFDRDKREAAGIETAEVGLGALQSTAWRSGRVAVDDERIAHIYPPAEGVVRRVPVRLGQTVAAGDLLVEIDCRELSSLKLELVKARAALATETESSDRARITTANAEELLRRLAADEPVARVETLMADKPIGEVRAQLFGGYARRNQYRAQLASQKASGNSVPESTLRKTEAEAETAEAAWKGLVEDLRYQLKFSLRQADFKRKEAEVAVGVARTKLLGFGLSADAVDKLDPIAEGADASLLKVVAPFAGTVVEKHAVLSERVGPTSQLFVLTDLSAVHIHADVFEADLAMVRGLAGRPVRFRSAVAGIAERAAKVAYVGDVIDKATRATTLIAIAANPDRDLKPGMWVEVGFDIGDATPVLRVPSSAVFRRDGKAFVFVPSGGDDFVPRDVTLGRTAGESVEVTVGLKPGETVVVRGGFLLKSEMLKDTMLGEK